jgi:hypothetical protein
MGGRCVHTRPYAVHCRPWRMRLRCIIECVTHSVVQAESRSSCVLPPNVGQAMLGSGCSPFRDDCGAGRGAYKFGGASGSARRARSVDLLLAALS